MYVCMYVCMYACMHACMHACIYVCMYVCMCVHVYLSLSLYIYIYTCVYISIYIYVSIYIHTHIHTCGGLCDPPPPERKGELRPLRRLGPWRISIEVLVSSKSLLPILISTLFYLPPRAKENPASTATWPLFIFVVYHKVFNQLV